jgi:membrane protease YdiL (CAAX protease family)
MWILTQLVRRSTAALVSSVLFGFIMLASLAACPFLMGESSQASDHSCCPRKPAPEKHCPASDNLASCPYFLTEAKLGKTEAKFSVGLAPAPVAPITHHHLNAAVVAVTMVDEDADGSGTYLRNRVLRI